MLIVMCLISFLDFKLLEDRGMSSLNIYYLYDLAYCLTEREHSIYNCGIIHGQHYLLKYIMIMPLACYYFLKMFSEHLCGGTSHYSKNRKYISI